MVHACCFHTGSASLCVDGRNDSTIFSPCQPFSRKKLVRTCGRRKGGRPRCARYSLGRRSLAGGSHTHPTLAVAWAAFAANAGGASVSSARREQETRHAAPGGVFRRAMRPHQPPGGPPRAPAPVAAGAFPRPPLAPWVRACPGHAARERFERPEGARNAACRTRRLSPPGHAPAHRPAEAPPRTPAPVAVGASPSPPLAPWVRTCPGHAARERCERPQGARNAACSTAPLATPGQPPAPAVRGLEGRSPPSEIVSPGFAGRAGSLRPWAQTFLTPSAARRAGGKAAGEVGGRRTPRRKRSAPAELF